MKIFSPLALIAVLLGVSGCGASSALDDTQFNGLRAQGKQFAKNVPDLDIAACHQYGTSGSQPNPSLAKTCLGNAAGNGLSKSQDKFAKFAAYIDNLSTEVDGACSTALKAFGAALTDEKETLAKAETQARSADLTAMNATLKSLNPKKTVSTDNAVEEACR